jgi:hypothetical protein
MQVDSFFSKGIGHKICEDYTMHGIVCNKPYIIICDGCSGSNETDFGARLLARAAKNAMTKILIYFDNYWLLSDNYKVVIDMLEEEIKSNLKKMLEATYSSISVIDATLLMAFSMDDKVYVYTRGDGTLSYKLKNENVNIKTINFPSNTPFYLSYDLDKTKLESYQKMENNQKEIISSEISTNGEIIQTSVNTLDFNNKIFYTFPIDKVEFISLMSDGVSAFQYNAKWDKEKDNNKISTNSIVKEMISYKNYAGEFVNRRMNRVLKDLEKEGIENFDDISSATIYLKEN